MGLVACALVAAACSSSAPPPPPAVVRHLSVSASFHSYHLTSVGLLSSIVDVGGGQYLVCDPSNVYRLTRAATGYTITRLARPTVPVWNPLGLAYRDGVLYVANGSGRDVLELRVDGNALSLLRRIANPVMREARGVVAESDGSVEVTDQAAGGVLRFRADGTLEWRAALTGAAGLARAGGHLFATSVVDHRVHEIDGTGKPTRSAGGLGVTRGRYLLPVGLTAMGNGVLVTDTHNGTITVLDGDLNVRDRVGGNGQGLDSFNFPIATLPVGDGYLVVDTFKYRIVHTDRAWTENEQVAFGQMVPVGRGRPLVVGTDPHPYTYTSLPGVDLIAALNLRRPLQFVGAFNGLDHVDGGTVQHLDMTDPQFSATSVTWADTAGSYVVIGSDQRGAFEVIDPATGMFTFVDVGPDSWWRSGMLLLSDNLRRDLNQVIAPAVAAFQHAKQLLSQKDVSREDAFNQALTFGKPRNWSADLSSAAGQQFLRSHMTADDARRYYDATLSQPQVKVVELLEVKYLSGS